MKKYWIFFMIIFLCINSWSATKYIKWATTDGDTYPTVNAANTAASAGDILSIVDSCLESATTTLKARITVEGNSGSWKNAKIMFVASRNLFGSTDSITFKNICVGYHPDSPATTFSYIIYLTNCKYFYAENCKFQNGGGIINSYKRGIAFRRTAALTPTRYEFSGCIFDSLTTPIYNGSAKDTLTKMPDMQIKNCIFLGCGPTRGNRSKITWNVFRKITQEMTTGDSCGESKHSWCYFDSCNGENPTWDETNGHHIRDTIANCVFNKSTHNVMIDLTDSIFIYSTSFTNVGTSHSCIYNHQNETNPWGPYQSTNAFIYNNTFINYNSFYAVVYANSNDSADGVYLNRNLFLKDGSVSLAKVKNGNADSCVWQKASPTYSSLNANTNKTDGFTINNVLDSNFWYYHKYNSTNTYSGSRKFLTNKKDTFSVISTGFSIADSIAFDFRHDNQYYDTNFIKYNTWWTGDTAQTFLLTSLDKSEWTKRDSTLTIAGHTDTLVTTALLGGTKYYWRLMSVANVTPAISFDSTSVDSVTLPASEPSIASIIPDSAVTTVSRKIAFNGTNFGDSKNAGYVKFGVDQTEAPLYLYWSALICTVTTPTTMQSGVHKIYLSNNTGEIDSSKTFTMCKDTIYLNSLSIIENGITPTTGYHTFNGAIIAEPVIDSTTFLFVNSIDDSSTDVITMNSFIRLFPYTTRVEWRTPVQLNVGAIEATGLTFIGQHVNETQCYINDVRFTDQSFLNINKCQFIRVEFYLSDVPNIIVKNNIFNGQIVQDVIFADWSMNTLNIFNIINNTFYTPQSANGSMLFINTILPASNFRIFNNIFHGNGHAINWVDESEDNVTDALILHNLTYNQSNEIYLNCDTLVDSTLIIYNANPNFDSLTPNNMYDFKVKSNSPCVDSGAGYASHNIIPIIDFFENLRYEKFTTIGAHEFPDSITILLNSPSDSIIANSLNFKTNYSITKPVRSNYIHITTTDSMTINKPMFVKDSIVYAANCKIGALSGSMIIPFQYPPNILTIKLNAKKQTVPVLPKGSVNYKTYIRWR